MKYFKWIKSRITRIIILITTLIAVVLTISLGSSLYTTKNVKTGGAYGGNGEVTIKLTKPNGDQYTTEELSRIYDNMIDHIDPLGINNIAQNSSIGTGGLVTFKKSGISTQKELEEFTRLITLKPRLGIYTTGGNTLFNKNGQIWSNPSMPKNMEEAAKLDSDFQAPFVEGAAVAIGKQEGQEVVRVKLKNTYVPIWGAITGALAQKKASITMWINYQQTRREMFEKGIMPNPNGNPFSEIHANLPDGKLSGVLKNNVFKFYGMDSPSNHLISTASINGALNSQEFVITLGAKATHATAKRLASQINYGSSTYKITTQSSMFTPADYGTSAFQKAVIAGIVVFSIIAIFMIVNYGLLGALSTIGMALYIFLTLTMFTIMRGEYSPETIASLIIGVGMAVDACIITFERLKVEIKSGNSVIKSNKIANKLSLSTIFDSNMTTIIVGFVLFYFGTSQIKGFSIMLILSILFTLLVMLMFVRLLSTTLVNLGAFNNRSWLAGVKKSSINAAPSEKKQKILNFNYIKNAKWFAIGSSTIIGISLIVFATLAGVAGKMSGGLNSSIDFSGGSKFTIINSSGQKNLKSDDAIKLKADLVSHLIKSEDVDVIYQNNEKTEARVQITSKDAISNDQIAKIINNPTRKYEIIGGSTTSLVAQKLIRDAMIAISVALLAIVIYTLVRFKWTYSVAAIVALVHDGLIVTAVFVITRIEFSPIFVAGLLSILGYSINDTIVTFDRVREKFKKVNNSKLDKKGIIKIANEAIRDTIKRSLLTSATTIMAVTVLLFFGNATKLEFNIAMLVGLVSGTYSSIFIATYVWVVLEAWSQKRSQSRTNKNFWKLKEKEEQVVVGINDFQD